MTIEVLARATDHPFFTGDEAERERYNEKGDIIVVRPSGWQWGSAEGLPDFIRLVVNGVNFREAENYMDRWELKPDISVDSFDTATDTGVIRISPNAPVKATGPGRLNRAAIEAYLQIVGGSNVRRDGGDVLFDWDVYACATSEGIFEQNLGTTIFVQVSYVDPTHTIAMTLPNENFVNSAIVSILRFGGDVQDVTGLVVTYTIERNDIRGFVRRRIMGQFEKRVAKHRFAIPRNQVDQIVSQGGVRTVNRNQFLSAVIDRAV